MDPDKFRPPPISTSGSGRAGKLLFPHDHLSLLSDSALRHHSQQLLRKSRGSSPRLGGDVDFPLFHGKLALSPTDGVWCYHVAFQVRSTREQLANGPAPPPIRFGRCPIHVHQRSKHPHFVGGLDRGKRGLENIPSPMPFDHGQLHLRSAGYPRVAYHVGFGPFS